VAENPREIDKPLRLRTITGVKEYDRSQLAGKVEDARIDGLLVYKVEDLYQKIRDENPPQTPAAHKNLAQRCMNIGAYEHAREHLTACKADDAFMQTSEGKAVEQMLRNAEVMIKAQDAQVMKQQALVAGHDNRWNDARKIVNDIGEKYKDDVIRKAIGYDMLVARTMKGRETYFQKAVAMDFFKQMDALIQDKSREKIPLASSTEKPQGGAAGQGTMAAATQWADKDLAKAAWEKVGKDMGLEPDELQKFWEHRTLKQVRRATYGTGTFVVVKKNAGAKGGQPEQPRRRPPSDGGNRGGKSSQPVKPKAQDKPPSPEEWWENNVTPPDRARWLTAWFVERSGYFEVISTTQTPCQGCGGAGFNKSSSSDGSEEQHFCPQCNGIGVFKSVTYR
jgi:hypothetical protein